MIALPSGNWELLELRLTSDQRGGARWYSAVGSGKKNAILVSGKGRTKAEALVQVTEKRPAEVIKDRMLVLAAV